MSKEKSTFTMDDSYPVKEETDKYLDHNSILLGFIKDETPTCQNIDDNNQLYFIENNVIIKSNDITHENFDKDGVNVPDIEKDKDGVQNSILIEDLVKKEFDIKEEMFTYLNNDIDNLTVNNNKLSNVTIDTLCDTNVCVEIKIEKYDNNTACPNKNLFNKIEQMSPMCCDIFTKNIFEIKTEKDCINTDIENSVLLENGCLVKEEIDVKNDIITRLNKGDNNQLYHTENVAMNNKSNKITYGTNIFEIKTEIDYNPNSFKTLKSDNKDANNSSIIQLDLFNKIEQMSPKCCDIFTKNIFEIKTEKHCINTDLENSILIENGCLVKEEVDVKNDIITCLNNGDNNQLYHTEKSKTNSFKNIHGKKYKCDICQKSFSREKEIENHMVTHTGEKPHKCEICHKSFSRNGHLNTHMFTHTGEKPHKCEICHKSFSRKGDLKTHMIIHTGEKPHKCNICQKLFACKAHLNIHVFTHTGEKPHICEICHKSFLRKGHLNIHMLTHTGEKPHKCEICHKSFSRKGHLNTHMFTHTGEKPHKCEICQKSFLFKGRLNTHMFSHTDEKPHKCEICHKSFSRKEDLKAHKIIHTREKPHKCEICQKSFSRKGNLDFHMFTHNNERPHKCEICQKSFTRKGNLDFHMFAHTGEKPHKCEICQKSFSHKEDLKVPMIIHTGEKPHKCEICQKSFTRKGNLDFHMFTHNDERPHICEICQNSGTRKSEFKNHKLIFIRMKKNKTNN